MKPCPYEINAPDAGAIAIVGTAPDAYASKAGRPFVGHLGRILEDAMAEAGLRRANVNLLHVSRQRPPKDLFVALKRDVIATEIEELHRTLRRLKPSVIVTLGVEAAHAVVPEWPDARSADGLIHRGNIKSATDLENRRGYVFDSPFGPVIPSKHPAEINLTWSPWRVLLSFDLQRAVEVSSNGLVRPTREVEIIRSDRDARRAVESLRRAGILGADIETWGDSSLACVGFAGSGGKAYVFPAEHLDRASELLGDPGLTTVWANGIYDLFVLKHRYGVEIRNRLEDAQVMWHACFGFDQLVQMLDGNRKPIQHLKVGDELLAFDEYPPDDSYGNRGRRRWVKSVVEAVAFDKQEVLEIMCEGGHVLRVTPDHPVLCEGVTSGKSRVWRKANNLRVTEAKTGMSLSYLFEPKDLDEYDAGYLGAIYDGEGSFSVGREGSAGMGLVVCFQKDNAVLRRVVSLMDKYGFSYSLVDRGDTKYVQLKGGICGFLEFLCAARPERIKRLTDALPRYYTRHVPKKILHVRSLGQQPIVQVKTSTKTLIVNGFAAHNCYPELAGAKEDRRKHRFTRKSLSFLASLSTFDEWWKGDYETRDEFFIYNGKDCLITRDVFDFTTREMERVGAEATYEHERDLIWPCVDMLQRGLRVDEDLRRERVKALEADLAAASDEATAALVPFLIERRDELEAAGVLHLFEETEPTCECCRHASKKQTACWSCVGFKSAPSKKDLMRVFGRFDGTKAEMEERFLPTCRVCGGAERKTFMTVNLNSDTQMKALLYDVLKMPKRFGRNTKGDSVLKADEATLKGLLGGIEG